MLIAFSAALQGGVYFQSEDVQRGSSELKTVSSVKGGAKVLDVVDLGANRDKTDAQSSDSESKVTRYQTEASIFISLFEHLSTTGVVRSVTEALPTVGDLISIETGPAAAPLRRVLDELKRFLEIANSARALPGVRENLGESIREIEDLIDTLTQDLDRVGMTDLVIRNEDSPSIVVTMDNRFISDQAFELLHSSRFTVVGKVTQVLATPEEIINVYRRSVLAFTPRLTFAIGWMLAHALFDTAAAVDPYEAQKLAAKSMGDEPLAKVDVEVRIDQELFNAILPVINGPAIQVLPLAMCA